MTRHAPTLIVLLAGLAAAPGSVAARVLDPGSNVPAAAVTPHRVVWVSEGRDGDAVLERRAGRTRRLIALRPRLTATDWAHHELQASDELVLVRRSEMADPDQPAAGRAFLEARRG